MSTPAGRWHTHSPEQTQAWAACLGRALQAGDVVALTGPLGAGKTQVVKGLAVGLEVPPSEPIVSPTFVLVREYAGRLRLFHLDAYRLGDPEELTMLGIEEMCGDPAGVVVVEWADRFVERLPTPRYGVALAHVEVTTREIVLSTEQGLPEGLLSDLNGTAEARPGPA